MVRASSEDERRLRPLWRRCVAELVGTFLLTLVAAGLEVVDVLHPGHIDRVVKAAGPALVVAAMIYAFGDVSGAHLNPVVTATFALRGAFPWRTVPAYWLAQLAGSTLAAATLRALFGRVRDVGVSRTDLTTGRAILVEALLTLLLVLAILSAAHKSSLIGTDAALAVGAALTACGMFGGELTTASMNPARSLGPALVAGRWSGVHVFVIGPMAGALVALAVMTAVHPRVNDDEQVAAEGRA